MESVSGRTGRWREADINTARAGKACIHTLEELIKRYEASNRAALKSDKTSTWYTENLLLFVRYQNGLKLPADLSHFNVDCARDYILHLRERAKFTGCQNVKDGSSLLKPKTIQCHVRTLKAFSTWLHTEGYTDENRLQNLKLPKAPSVLIQPLTPEEIRRILKRIGTHTCIARRNLTVFMLALDTGLRESEIVSIDLGDLNLEAGQIKVMGKGSKERVVPVGNRVRLELYAYIKKERAKFDYARSNRLFLSPDGVPLSVNAIKLMFSRLARLTKIPRLHCHLCRHTFGVNYLLNGGDVFSLKAILGHASLDMVNHYLHFTSAQISEQHRKYSPIDNMMGKNGK